MNSAFIVLLLASVAFASVDPHSLFPCSFELMTYTVFYSGGSELTSSMDAIYHDHDNLWRWDSEFNGIPGLFDGHTWSVIWRPDDGASYHDNTVDGTCLKNNGGSKMYPYPYDWIASKTDGLEWSENDIEYEGKKAFRYTGLGSSQSYDFKIEVNLYVLSTGEFVYGNGTVTGSLVDLTFTVTVSKFTFREPIPSGVFVPAVPACPATTIPADPTRDFQKYCYSQAPVSSSGTSIIKPSLVLFLATLLMAVLILVSV